MVDVSEYVNKIRTARYGEEVRGSIANAIESMGFYTNDGYMITGYMQEDGSLNDTSYESLITDLIPVNQGDVFLYSGKAGSNAPWWFGYSDDMSTIVDTSKGDKHTAARYFSDFVKVQNENIKYMRFQSISNDDKFVFMLYRNKTPIVKRFGPMALASRLSFEGEALSFNKLYPRNEASPFYSTAGYNLNGTFTEALPDKFLSYIYPLPNAFKGRNIRVGSLYQSHDYNNVIFFDADGKVLTSVNYVGGWHDRTAGHVMSVYMVPEEAEYYELTGIDDPYFSLDAPFDDAMGLKHYGIANALGMRFVDYKNGFYITRRNETTDVWGFGLNAGKYNDYNNADLYLRLNDEENLIDKIGIKMTDDLNDTWGREYYEINKSSLLEIEKNIYYIPITESIKENVYSGSGNPRVEIMIYNSLKTGYTGYEVSASLKRVTDGSIKLNSSFNLKGKILAIDGDSEAYGHTLGFNNAYGNLIALRNGMSVYNYAKNGRKLASGNDGNLVDAFNEIRSDADYILIQIGYNDDRNFDDGVDDDSHDRTTVKGAYNVLIEGIMSTYPDAKFGMINPYYFEKDGMSSGLNNSKRIARTKFLKSRCEHYHVPFIDGTAVSGLSREIDSQGSYFMDDVHLTEKGHMKMSYIYERFMKSL